MTFLFSSLDNRIAYLTILFGGLRIPITLLLAWILFQLGQVKWILPYTGDGHYTVELVLKGWVVLMHSSLTTLMHRFIYVLLHPFGWEAWDSVSWSSALAGGIVLQVYFAFRRHPLFLLINIFSGSFLVFVGEVEIYAWVNLFLLLSFYAVEQYLLKRWRIWPAILFTFIAALFHMLALFYLPALFWIMRKDKTIRPSEFLYPFSGYMILTVGILILFPSEGLDLDFGRFTPLFQIQRKGQFFTFFSLPHWELLAYFHWRGCFLQCLPLEIPLLILMRKRINTLFKKYLLICSLIGIVWTTAWHPDLGRLDWDLFSQMFIPIHLLLGILVSETFPQIQFSFHLPTFRRQETISTNRLIK